MRYIKPLMYVCIESQLVIRHPLIGLRVECVTLSIEILKSVCGVV